MPKGEVAGAAASDHAALVVITHHTIAAQVVAVQVEQVTRSTLDHLPHGDGLPGEEVDFAPGDGVFGLDAAAVVSVGLRAL